MKIQRRKPVKASDGSEMIGMLNELTKGMWFEPMSKFSQIVYNADEIIPLIDYDDCVEFGTNNGQELLIYDEVNGRKHIRYSCSMTTIFNELVLTDVWDNNGQVYECDYDAIYDELAKKHNFNGSVKASRKSASKRAIKASNRPAPRRRSVKASTYGDAFETIERSKDAYIQRWSEEYEGTPATSWDNIFDNVLEEFTRYADDESSGFILEKFENGEYTADDMDNEFEQYTMWLDLNEYDQDYYA